MKIEDSLYYIYDDNKNVIPATREESFAFRNDPSKRIIKQEYIGDYFISTVFLTCDHNFDPTDDTPIMFETMVFDGCEDNNNWSEIYCERYATYDEAVRGHEIAMLWMQDGCKDETF